LGSILVGYTYAGEPVFARDLQAVGAMAILLKEALKPNLAQTLEGQPAFIHGGPFANIAHGNNSILATKLALKLGDYVVTEGGFASDLGAEKFFDIISPQSGIKPSVAVLVASVRALKSHGGVAKEELDKDNPQAVSAGLANLEKHLSNLTQVYGLPVVVAVNKFPTDSNQELETVLEFCRVKGVPAEISTVVAEGGAGGVKLAETVLKTLAEGENRFAPLYSADMSIKEKINTLATKIYGADGVVYTKEAEKTLAKIKQMGLERLPVCVAKTQMSLSDDPARKGAPRGWTLTVRDLKISAGAGFIVVLAGNILTMPGLPPVPAAEKMDLKADGTIIGLF
jgi:formate--tetrahydrofolate ligase